MKCSKCGNEVIGGSSYCANCGNKIDIKEEAYNKTTIKIKLSHLIIAIFIIIIIVSLIIIYALKKQRESTNLNSNNVQTEIQKNTEYQVEIGVTYSYILNDEISSIRFNTDKDFIIRTGIVSSEEIIETGTYIIDGNVLKLTVNYDSSTDYGDDSADNLNNVPYTKEMKILDDGNIEYTTEYGTYLYIKEESNNGTDISFEGDNDILIEENINDMEKIDRKTFVNNLSEENKQDIKQYIIGLKELDFTNFVEDRISTEGEEIIYTYIYVESDTLRASIYVITPAQEIPRNLHQYVDEFYNYFVVKDISTFVSLSKSEGISDSEIEAAIEELNPKIEENIDYFKKFTPFNEQFKRICHFYELHIQEYYNYIPTDYESNNLVKTYNMYPPDEGKGESTSWRKSGYYCSADCYYQVIDNNKILKVQYLRKRTKAENYKEYDTIELMAYGIYINLDELPLLFSKFEIEELILTGYLPKDVSEENFVMTPVTKLTSNEFENEEKQKEIYEEQNEYIRSHFKL